MTSSNKEKSLCVVNLIFVVVVNDASFALVLSLESPRKKTVSKEYVLSHSNTQYCP